MLNRFLSMVVTLAACASDPVAAPVYLAPFPDAPPPIECIDEPGVPAVTQAEAAKMIGEAYCATTGGGAACLDSMMDFYCPPHVTCSRLICGDDQTRLATCIQVQPPSGDCQGLFPAVPSIETRHEVPIHIHPAAGQPALGLGSWIARPEGAEVSSGTGAMLLWVPLDKGDIISGFTVRWIGTTYEVGVTLMSLDPVGSVSPIHSMDLPISNTWRSADQSMNYAPTAGESIVMQFSPSHFPGGAIPLLVGTVTITVSRLRTH